MSQRYKTRNVEMCSFRKTTLDKTLQLQSNLKDDRAKHLLFTITIVLQHCIWDVFIIYITQPQHYM